MCVGTNQGNEPEDAAEFQCRTQHDVCWDTGKVEVQIWFTAFQCRTQHDVCWDKLKHRKSHSVGSFNAARSMMCVGTRTDSLKAVMGCFNAARSMMCVGTTMLDGRFVIVAVSMPHAA